ncbi:uncharacterized protein LDX57_001903 [Aspergillus melleus]|uniref:uncharacterized protein n=1 Tax=Aspergillus melleus TaxID=138277 RepID=UPI001E8DE8D2|nr:uncharacterized protein LDX57_001903 [Aspergillus melleus]KAH8424149.1 hypothetical protein LDX57_001903 [Aspergillus melleus]
MQQFNQLKNWRRSSVFRPPAQDPVLTAEDERFLQNIVTETGGDPVVSPPAEESGSRSPVSPLGTDAPTLQSPVSPVEEFGRELGEEGRKARELAQKQQSGGSQTSKTETATPIEKEKKKRWTWLRRKSTQKNTENVRPETPSQPPSQPTNGNDDEAKQDAEDMTEILERLNLAADNNKVISISDETQELLRKFKLIFKDLINGVPTAYQDLEMLLTNGNKTLQSTYSKLPSFLQKLIEKLPERWTESLAPEIIAAASDRAGKSGINVENVGKAAAAANKMGIEVPSLKELVGKPAAIVGMLRSIVAFLRARFPAVLGMNVLWSLALTILLFVLWYCHKRGREVRLENERLVTEAEIEQLNEQAALDERIRATETPTTTAPQGASAAEIRQGMREAEQTRESAAATPINGPSESGGANETHNPPAPKPARSKSILSIWGRSNQRASTAPAPKIEPYPGT